MLSKYVMSRWGDRDRKRSKKQKVKVFDSKSKERTGEKELDKQRREDQFNRELERFGQDLEESSNDEDSQTLTMFNERTR